MARRDLLDPTLPVNSASQPTAELKEGELLAAVDLGSNSFHLVVARFVLNQLRIVDRLRETVRLAAGLDARGHLTAKVTAHAIDCLAQFGQRLHSLPHNRVRAIATSAVRQLKHPQSFLIPAETALGHPIEVVSGREEARLIYLGVAHGLPRHSVRRLVIDIGGGSTEFIIGEGFEALERESLQVGCIASTRRFFANGKLSRSHWQEGLTAIAAELQQFSAAYRARGWNAVFGSSGTIKAVGQLLTVIDKSARDSVITREGIAQLRERLLSFKRIDRIDLPGLPEDRKSVLPGGVLVLEACFHKLSLDSMQVAETAMREGVLYDMLGRAQHTDPRESSVAAMAVRYGADSTQASRIEATALTLFDQVCTDWLLTQEHRDMLAWAARLHEIGLAIAHSQHHIHGAYLIEHSDLAGFSRQEQQMLATLVRCQRRSLSPSLLSALPGRLAKPALRCAILLRLAILLHRSHERESLPAIRLAIQDSDRINLTIAGQWLDRHPLVCSDLAAERLHLAPVGVSLQI